MGVTPSAAAMESDRPCTAAKSPSAQHMHFTHPGHYGHSIGVPLAAVSRETNVSRFSWKSGCCSAMAGGVKLSLRANHSHKGRCLLCGAQPVGAQDMHANTMRLSAVKPNHSLTDADSPFALC